jgi:histidinol-phosphate aminotransferase
MDITRRFVLRALAAGTVSPLLVSARGLEAYTGLLQQEPRPTPMFVPPKPGQIRLDGNENPLGPGKRAMDALVAAFGDAGRYPSNSIVSESDFAELLASSNGAKPENVVLGAGSGEILRTSVRAFTSKERALVTATPTFATSTSMAQTLGHPVREIPLDAKRKLDLGAMADAASGAGLVYFCNPNNPTATLHSAAAVRDFVDRVAKASPDAVILVDEAYHDYVTDPAYESAIPLALERENLVVARTFSKAYGMAGLRLGYGVGRNDTIAKLQKFRLRNNTNVLVLAAAAASVKDPGHIEEERKRNTEVRAFTMSFFQGAGYAPTDSQANFLFVDLGTSAKAFRDACAAKDVIVGRDFPPLEKAHSRISLGTMDEMKKATKVFAEVLGTMKTSEVRS